MTISSTVRIAGPYIGSGAATVFPFAFKVFAAAEMQVAKLNTTSNVETILVLNTDYTVQLNGDQNSNPGGTITTPAVLASGYNLTITSDIANLQPTDLTNQGGFYPEVITDALDRATIQIQQLDQNSRAIKIPLSDGVLDMTTPVVAERANKYLAFDAAGLPVVSAGTGSDSALRTDLANATAVSAGSRLSGFRQTGTGATARTVDAKLKDTVSVKDFGAVGNGATDDTVAIQAAISATVAGGTLMFPAGNYIITSQLNIANSITIRGSTQFAAAIIAIGCSGLLISSVSNVQIHNIEIAAAVRHTTTPNAYIGIDVDGSTGTRPFNHVYRDIYIDGFYTAYRSAWLWSSTFNNFKTNYGAIGINATNLSVNNVVSGCSFGGTGLAGSRGIILDGSINPTEGWMISDTLIYNFEIGIESIAATHVFINNCILDFNINTGILINSGVNFGGNWTVRGCYIAMSGALGDAAIKSTNSVTNSQNRGNIITGNQLIVYAGCVCGKGIWMQGTQAINNAICENTIKGFGTSDIYVEHGLNIITNNKCQSTVTYNLYITGNSIVKNNDGILYFNEFLQYETLGKNKVTWSYNIPTTGTWTQGDICWKSNIAAGGIPGWVCVTGGTPGTWKAMAAVAV